MVTKPREKFANPRSTRKFCLLCAILPQHEGRQLQVLIEEALCDLIEKRKLERPRAHVMAAYQVSHENFAPLYKKLASDGLFNRYRGAGHP